jgi:hypothetical protein
MLNAAAYYVLKTPKGEGKSPRAPEQQTEERQNVSSKTNNQTKRKHNKPNKHTISFFYFIFFFSNPLSVYTRSMELLVYMKHTQ